MKHSTKFGLNERPRELILNLVSFTVTAKHTVEVNMHAADIK
jgi:hypothetical protein